MTTIRFSYKYNRKNRLNKQGEALVLLVAYQPRSRIKTKHRYISTSIYLKPHQWNDEQKLVVNHPSAPQLNFQLSAFKAEYEKRVIDLINRSGECCLKDLDKQQRSNFQSFIEFYENELVLEQGVKSKSTLTTYETALARLKEYRSSICFNDLDYAFIQGWDKYLKSIRIGEKGKTKRALRQTVIANKYHSKLRYIINQAIRKDLMDHNPYSRFKIQDGIPRPKEFLEKHEIEALEKLVFSPAEMYLEIERDAYLFSVWTALRYGTNSGLKLSMFEKRADGYCLKTRAKKGIGKYIFIPLAKLFPNETGPSKPEAIIIKYEKINRDLYGHNYKNMPLFGELINQTTNKRLKILAQRAGIKKNISSHSGRTSFCVQMANKIPINYLQAMMGHSKIQTTMVYAQISEKVISDSLDKVVW